MQRSFGSRNVSGTPLFRHPSEKQVFRLQVGDLQPGEEADKMGDKALHCANLENAGTKPEGRAALSMFIPAA